MYQQWRKKAKKIPRLQKKCTTVGSGNYARLMKNASCLLNIGTHHAGRVAVRIFGDLAVIVSAKLRVQN